MLAHVAAVAALVSLCVLAPAAHAAEGDVALVAPGAEEVSVSADGSVIGFVTREPLDPQDENESHDVYVALRGAGEPEYRLISRTPDGASGFFGARGVEVSADGSTVAFLSDSSDLVDGDSNGRSDVFVADVESGAVQRANLDEGGGQAGDGFLPDPRPSLSDDGTLVAFADSARLTAGAPLDGSSFVYVRNLADGTTRFASEGNWPSLSGDGTVLAYQRVDQVYAQEGGGGEELVSATPSGEPAAGFSGQPDVSTNGNLIAFASEAQDMLLSGEAADGQGVFLRDRFALSTELVSRDDRSVPAPGTYAFPGLSGDGRFVAFLSTEDPNGCMPENLTISVRDRDRESTFGAGRAFDGGLPNGPVGFPFGGEPSVAAGGTLVGYPSFASNLVEADDNDDSDGFVTELGAIEDPNVITTVSAPRAGEADGSIEFELSVCRPAGRMVPTEVGYETEDGTATAGEDYEPASGAVDVPADQSTAIVSVPILDDEADEPWETLRLRGASGTAFEPRRIRGTIVDDDLSAEPGPIYYREGDDIVVLDGDAKTIGRGHDPAVSRDGQRLAYIRSVGGDADELVVSDASGENPQTVLTAQGDGPGFGFGRPAWSPDGSRLAVSDFVGDDEVDTADIKVLDPDGGEPELVVPSVEYIGETLSYSPDGTSLVFDQARFDDLGALVREIVTLDLDSGAPQVLEQGSAPSYGPDGDIVFVRSERLMILEDGADEATSFDPGPAPGDPSEFGHDRPAYAPDGSAVVFERVTGTARWIVSAPLAGGEPMALTPRDGDAGGPAWARSNGPAPPLPTVSIADASAPEGDQLQFAVTLSAAASSDVTVTGATTAGTATSPADYVTRVFEVTIPAGQTQAVFDVTTAEDSLDEPDETLTVNLSNPSGATIGDGTATGTIVDDDAQPTVSVFAAAAAVEGGELSFPVRLSQASGSDVTVQLSTQDGTAAAPGDYTARSLAQVTIPAGQTEAFFEVQTVDDPIDENDETVHADIKSGSGATPGATRATGTIQDDDEPPPTVRVDTPAAVTEGAPLRFPVRLDRAAPSDVQVRLSTADGAATAPGDYTAQSLTQVTIPAGQTETFLDVPTVDDPIDENDETVHADIKSGSGATPGATRATGTIQDNDDDPPPTVRVDTPAAVTEGAPLRFPVRLDRPAPSDVQVRLSTTDGTAKAPGDYTAQALTQVTIPAGQTEAFLDVPTADDGLTETDETVGADIKSGGGAQPGATSATGTIRDAVAVRLVPGKTFGGQLVSGVVKVKLPGTNEFVDVGAGAEFPVGAQVDATNGVLQLTAALGTQPVPLPSAARRKTQSARVSGGIFTIRQARRSSPVTLVLSGPELKRCPRGKGVRRLWVDANGRFQTKGRHADATSTGGRWLTEDRCRATKVKVKRGKVSVRAKGRGKTKLVRKGRALTVRAR